MISSSEHLLIAIVGLTAGTYNLTLVVNDESRYSIVDTVIINVTEEIITTSIATSSTTMLQPDNPMFLTIMIVGVIGAIVFLLLVAIRKK